MYRDYFPPLERGFTPPCKFVAVVTTNERVRPEAILAVCERYGATSIQSEGKCFWIVYEDEPKRAWPFTEKALRCSVDSDGYIKCDSYARDDARKPDVETPNYMIGDVIADGSGLM